MDHNEFCCIFDTTQYTGVPDSHPCPRAVDVPALIRRLDALYAGGREAEAESFLEGALVRARSGGDWRAELSILSELLGQYRRSMHEQAGLRTVNEALDIIREHHMGQTVSAATVMLNAATTLKCFGRADESIPIFSHVARVYADNLDSRRDSFDTFRPGGTQLTKRQHYYNGTLKGIFRQTVLLQESREFLVRIKHVRVLAFFVHIAFLQGFNKGLSFGRSQQVRRKDCNLTFQHWLQVNNFHCAFSYGSGALIINFYSVVRMIESVIALIHFDCKLDHLVEGCQCLQNSICADFILAV